MLQKDVIMGVIAQELIMRNDRYLVRTWSLEVLFKSLSPFFP